MDPFRRRRTADPAPGRPSDAAPAVRFAGIAEESLTRPGFSPYEFDTQDGVHVYLHDMRFLGAERLVDPSSLVLTFVYDDPGWTPPEAVERPVVLFRFHGVRIWSWEDDHDAATPALGQVSAFDWYPPTNYFELGTSETAIGFSAGALDVSTAPRVG